MHGDNRHVPPRLGSSESASLSQKLATHLDHWGTVCEGRSFRGKWNRQLQWLHINALELFSHLDIFASGVLCSPCCLAKSLLLWMDRHLLLVHVLMIDGWKGCGDVLAGHMSITLPHTKRRTASCGSP